MIDDLPEKIPTNDEYILFCVRARLRMLLMHCTEEQQTSFVKFFPEKLFPDGIDSMPIGSLRNATNLVIRTIYKNREKAK